MFRLPYSILKNPIGAYRVATAGQLQILYTMIMIDRDGYDVVYCNTDGFSILIDHYDEKEVEVIKIRNIWRLSI